MYALIIVAVAVLSSLLTAIFFNRRNKTAYNRLNAMLDAANDHTFTETSFDETRLSQIESKMNRFLTASTSGEQNINREKDRIKQLISDISHQTKTPIANVLMYVELLRESGEDRSPGMELTRQITQQAEKLNFLIQALIKTSRMEAGIIHVHPQVGRIHELLQRTVAQVEKDANLKRIRLQINCAEDITAVYDSKWTEEALFNILDNSIKYTPEQGRITVSAITYELFTRIDITDTGIGIEEEEINLIFKRFYRSPDVGQVAGVGIGLYLAREIITMQQGYIKVSSTFAKGSTFSVFLPRESVRSKSVKIDRFQKDV
jgi:signal transduction histidine kinase